MMRIKEYGDGEGKMGTVYNQVEKRDQSRLGFSLWCSVYQFSFVVSTIYLLYLFKGAQNK